MDVLEKITLLREKRNWTIWKLSLESGVDQSTISAWYSKGRSPSVASLEKICSAFGITLAQFFTTNEKITNITTDQQELLESWTVLSRTQKDKMLELIKSMIE